MRRHLGDGFPLMADANMKWSADQAIRAARAGSVSALRQNTDEVRTLTLLALSAQG